MALRSGALSTGQNLRACQNGRLPRIPARPGGVWQGWAGSELLEVLGAFSGHFCSRFPDPRPVPTRRPSQHAERSSGIEASDGADPQRPIAAEVDRDGRSRRICGAGGRKWGIWRWVVTPSWSLRGAPPDRPRGPVRREQWIKTICFVRTRHTFSKICCGNALRAPLIRTRFLR